MAIPFTREIKRALLEPFNRSFYVAHVSRAGIAFRRVGGRKRTPVVPWAKVWGMAQRMAAEEAIKARAEARKARKAGRA